MWIINTKQVRQQKQLKLIQNYWRFKWLEGSRQQSLMSYSTSEYNRTSVNRRSSYMERPSPYQMYTEKSKYLDSYENKYQSKAMNEKVEGYQSKLAGEIRVRNRSVLGGVDNYESFSKTNFSKKAELREPEGKTRNQMIENIDKIQSKIKGILGQH